MHLAVRPLREVDEFKLLLDPFLALGVRHAGKFEAEADIFRNRTPGQQCELLKHHGDGVHPQIAQRLRGACIGIYWAGCRGN